MPLITDLFTGLEMQHFKPFSEVTMNIGVDNGEAKFLTCASGSKCDVKYRWDYTPQWFEMSPKVLAPGMMTTLFVRSERAMEYRRAGIPPLDWRLDGMSVDMSMYIDAASELSRWGTSFVKGRALNQARNKDVSVEAMFAGVGRAWKEFEDGRHCNVY